MTDFLARRGEEICRWSLLALYAGANLLFSTQTFNIVLLKDLFAPAVSLLLLLVWIAGETEATGRWAARRTPANLPLSLLFLFLAHSAATSPAPYESVEEFARFFVNFLILLALPKFLTDRNWLERLLSTIFWVAVVATGYGLSQWAEADALVLLGSFLPEDWAFSGWGQGVFISTHGNANFYSGYLVATIPILAGLWLSERRTPLLFFLPVLLVAMILSVVRGEARGAYLGLGAAIAVFAVVYLLRARSAPEKDPAASGLRRRIAAAALALTALFGVARPDAVAAPIVTVRDNLASLVGERASYTNRVRLVLWQTWLDGWEREPLLGRGLGVSNVRMPETRPDWYHHAGVAHNSDHAHNEWFEWAMEGGVVGASLYVWLHLAVFGAWIRTLRARWRDEDFPILLGAGLGLLSQLVQSFFDPETRWTGNAVTNHFCAGLMLAWAHLPPPGDVRARAPWDGVAAPSEAAPRTVPVLAAGAFAILFFFYGSIRVWRADHHYRNASSLTGGGTARYVAAAARESLVASAYNPHHLTNHYTLALVHLAVGDAPGALRALRRLQALAPNFVQIHEILAAVKDDLGDRYGGAWERSRQATIENSTPQRLAAAEAWARLGRPERAVPHLRHVLAVTHDDEEGSRTVLFYRHDEVRKALAALEPPPRR